MDQTKSYFVYSPPKSNSHGHAVRDKNIKRATQKAIEAFVSNFNARTDNNVQLTLYYDKKNELQKAIKTIEKLNAFLGPAKHDWDNTNPLFAQIPNSVTWESNTINMLDMLDYINQFNSEDFLPLSNYWICCSYNYGIPPEPYGHIMYSIEQGRLFLRLHLIFPYSIDDEKSYQLLSNFHASLPFKFNGNHFRRLGPSKRGYGQWKLDEETQHKVDACLIESKLKIKK